MSRKFALFLEEQGIDWHVLDSKDQRQLRLELSDTACKDPSRTVQADRDLVDLNKIVARHRAAGLPLPEGNMQFGDATAALTYQQSLEAASRASEMFARLPSRVRARFLNEPGELLRFMADPGNREEAYSLGLIKRPSVRKPPQGAPSEPPVEGASGGAPPSGGAGAGA